ncbi:MAG: ArgE/DapE family deacylase [Actinomycetes bacterium]
MNLDASPASALETRIVAAVAAGEEELVRLTADLIGFDTTARNPGDPPREEARLEVFLQARLEALGADTDLWEPEPTGRGDRFVPDDLDFVGRPQLAARLAGSGGGRSLLLNGHIDAVSHEPISQWSSHPLKAEIRDGELYGRGACDMKGGIAGMLHAVETLNRLGVRLGGDVVWCTNTDEESSGAGSYACVRHGVKADAGLCAEPTGFDVWLACRGGVNPHITIEGRPGHSEVTHPHWQAGGPVNAIERYGLVLDAIRTIREDWRTRPDHLHPYLSPPDILTTVIHGGEWMVTYPSSCEITLSVQYLPGSVDADGTGQAVFDEVERRINAAAATDSWLAEHPLRWDWPCDIVPAEVPDDHPVISLALDAATAVGRTGVATGMDSWHDAAVYTRRAQTPTVSFGPGDLMKAHTIDESVPVRDLVDFSAAVALALVRWCGVAGTE